MLLMNGFPAEKFNMDMCQIHLKGKAEFDDAPSVTMTN